MTTIAFKTTGPEPMQVHVGGHRADHEPMHASWVNSDTDLLPETSGRRMIGPTHRLAAGAVTWPRGPDLPGPVTDVRTLGRSL